MPDRHLGSCLSYLLLFNHFEICVFSQSPFKYGEITLEIKAKSKCYELGVVAQACNSSILEVETGGSQEFQG